MIEIVKGQKPGVQFDSLQRHPPREEERHDVLATAEAISNEPNTTVDASRSGNETAQEESTVQRQQSVFRGEMALR